MFVVGWAKLKFRAQRGSSRAQHDNHWWAHEKGYAFLRFCPPYVRHHLMIRRAVIVEENKLISNN